MAKTEDIEAKLAAYVDGEIDAAGREEIEKHLATNPQHAQLIAELKQQRQLLAQLPREAAPADVAEQINAQLERAALLGDDADDDVHAGSVQISRWSQFRAIAAVLVLVAGLAAVVYVLLPSPAEPPNQLAGVQLPPPGSEGTETLATTDRDAIAEKEGAPTASVAAPVQPEVATPPESDQERRAKGALAWGGAPASPKGTAVTSNVAPAGEQMFNEVVTDQMKLGKAGAPIARSAQSPLVVVVPTENPQSTNERITRYLEANNISWQSTTEPMPQPLNIGPSQQVLASRLRSQNVQWKNGAAPSGAAAGAASRPYDGQMPSQQLPSPQLQAQPSQAPVTQQQVAQQEVGQQQVAQYDRNQQKQQDASIGAMGQRYEPGQQVILARVTRQQASDIKNEFAADVPFNAGQLSLAQTNLAANQPQREAERALDTLVTKDTSAAPTTLPQTAIATGNLEDSVDKKLGEPDQPDQAKLEEANRRDVNATLPQQVDFGAAATTQPLQIATTQPSTAPTTMPEYAQRAEFPQQLNDQMMAANAAAGKASATTQPAPSEPAAAPADLVDVVIVVQSTTQPTTQPANAAEEPSQMQAPAKTQQPAQQEPQSQQQQAAPAPQ